jgi:integrase
VTAAWVTRWGDVIAAEPDAPGVWRRKAGGFRVRGRIKDPKTGKLREVNRALPDVRSKRDAMATLAAELARITVGEAERVGALPHFADWAATVFERKVAEGRILSASGREKWSVILRAHLVPAFGEIYVDKLTAADIEQWKVAAGQRIRAGQMSPNTGNTILSVLRVITSSAADEFDVPDPCRKVRPFDTRGHRTYTEEEPNSLAPADVPRFLDVMRRRYPQHFAFVFLGFTTGLRPSSLRPLRRSGPESDIKWDEGVLLVRRSHTRGSEIMAETKTGADQRIRLPPALLDVMRWHADHLPPGPMRDSDLLFPAHDGALRSTWNLRKAFAAVRRELDLPYAVSPRAMRRTFQDLAREAGVADVVTRAISGHATEAMQRRYSTARAHEVEAGLARVIDIATARRLAA